MPEIPVWTISEQNGGELARSTHAPLKGRVLLNVLAVLIQGGGANALQLSTGQGRLKDVGSINGALRSTSTDQGVHLVNHLHLHTGASSGKEEGWKHLQIRRVDD